MDDFFSLDKYCTSTSACVSAPGDEFHSELYSSLVQSCQIKKKIKLLRTFNNCVDKVFITFYPFKLGERSNHLVTRYFDKHRINCFVYYMLRDSLESRYQSGTRYGFCPLR